MSDGSFFGEIAITSEEGAVRGCSVVSATVLKLQRLTRTALEDVARLFPQIFEYIRAIALERQGRLGEIHRAEELQSAIPSSVQSLLQLKHWTAAAKGAASAGRKQIRRMNTGKFVVRSPPRITPHQEASNDEDKVTELVSGALDDSAGKSPVEMGNGSSSVRAFCEEDSLCETASSSSPQRVDGNYESHLSGFGARGQSVRMFMNLQKRTSVQAAEQSQPEWLRALNEMVRQVGLSHGRHLSVEEVSQAEVAHNK